MFFSCRFVFFGCLVSAFEAVSSGWGFGVVQRSMLQKMRTGSAKETPDSEES